MKELVVVRLLPSDADSLSALLTGDDREYGRHFIPFEADRESIEARLGAARDDRYWGIRFGDELAGFFMLRGFDEGYRRPSFGVYVSRAFSRRGLSKLALDHSMCWCLLNGIRSVMLKVHPENVHARKTYEKAGFRFVEACPATGHDMMEKRWDHEE